MTAPVILVVNPASGAGRTGRRLGELEAAARQALGPVDVWATAALGHGRELAARAAGDGARLVIAVGGDGTASEVVDGLMRAGGTTAFGLVPGGTGSDLAKTLGMSASWPEAFAQIAAATPRATDVLHGSFVQPAGDVLSRHGINVIGMGMAGDVVARVNRGSKKLGGTLSFLGSTLAALAAWRHPEVAIRWTTPEGDEGSWSGSLTNLFIANGRYCGGGMLVGPASSMHDGVLDGVIIPKQPLLRLAAQTPHLYDGRLPGAEGVTTFRATTISARAVGDKVVPCDIDGEQPGALPATVTVLPGALPVHAPWRPRNER